MSHMYSAFLCRARVKKTEQLITLNQFLRRVLVGFCGGVFTLVGISGFVCWYFLEPLQLSVFSFIIFGVMCLVGSIGLISLTTRYVRDQLARPITHLIANTQLSANTDSYQLEPTTRITEINILSRSIRHMLGKILRREHNIIGSERRLSLALRGSGEGVWDWDIQENNSYIDPNCCSILDVKPEELAVDNRLWLKRLFAEDAEQARQYFRRVAAGELTSFEGEYRIPRHDTEAEYRWIQIRGSVVEWSSDGLPTRMSGTVSDVTQRKISEQQLRLYSTAFKCTKNAVVMLDKDFRILAANRAFCQISGQQEHLVVGRSYIFQHPEIPSEQFHKVIKMQVNNRMEWHGEALGVRADGSNYPQELAVYGVYDDFINLTHYVTIFSDITERKRTEENLRVLANYDPLTGLANRYMFNATFTRSLQSARRKNEKLALLFIDLDHFKQVNDLLGHEAGDRLLVEVANRIQGSIRETDIAARLAGDEFVVILENIQAVVDAEQVALKILYALSNQTDSADNMSRISASIGVSVFPDHGNDPETLLRSADRAMYDAKTLGRNRLNISTGAIECTVAHRQLMDNGNVN
jgi:diguanylate cyclase (GGDEF)-like protein/PAS domain S-box-containing protein